MRPPRARSEPCLTLSPVASQQLVEPAAVHPVVPGQLSDRTPFQKVRLYQIPPQLHRKTLQPRCLLCLDTCVSPGVAYLLNSHTFTSTREAPGQNVQIVLRPKCSIHVMPSVGLNRTRNYSPLMGGPSNRPDQVGPVGLKNLDSDAPSRILMGHAARWYSLISPPRICFRRTRASIGIVVRSVEEFGASGGRWPRERCGPGPL